MYARIVAWTETLTISKNFIIEKKNLHFYIKKVHLSQAFIKSL